jgi:hypothetical protein
VNGGQAILDCTVGEGGAYSTCTVVTETPPGAGFGRAAIQSMRAARMATGPSAPRPGDRIRGIMIRFWDGTGSPPT